jgi:hypothetical protein
MEMLHLHRWKSRVCSHCEDASDDPGKLRKYTDGSEYHDHVLLRHQRFACKYCGT